MARIAILVEKMYEDLELQYPRLRLGIDPPPQFVPGRDYVLGKFSEAQREPMRQAIARACDAIVTWVDEGIERAMNRFNAEDVKDGKTPKDE